VSNVLTTLMALAAVSMLFLAAVAIESRSTEDRRALWHSAGFNLAYYAGALALLFPIQAVMAPALVALVNSAGGGLIRLSGTGWSLAAGIPAATYPTVPVALPLSASQRGADKCDDRDATALARCAHPFICDLPCGGPDLPCRSDHYLCGAGAYAAQQRTGTHGHATR
jgi:hypothetical protein